MAPSGTFEYVVRVPRHDEQAGRAWSGSVRVPVPISGSDLRDNRLVGLAPTLSVGDGDSILDGWTPDVPIPDMPRSKITLTASARDRSSIRAASFHIAAALVDRLLAGDVIELTRTAGAGLGLAVLRGDQLMVAAGAISTVPLGIGVRASINSRKTARPFSGELPIQVSVGRKSRTLSSGNLQLGSYDLFVSHGYLRGIPGTSECAALYRSGDCLSAAAIATALLLRYGKLEMVKW